MSLSDVLGILNIVAVLLFFRLCSRRFENIELRMEILKKRYELDRLRP